MNNGSKFLLFKIVDSSHNSSFHQSLICSKVIGLIFCYISLCVPARMTITAIILFASFLYRVNL